MANWDESIPVIYSDTIFHSPPTSAFGNGIYRTVLCREPPVQCLTDGKLEGWYYRTASGDAVQLELWNQAPLGSASDDNCYMVLFYLTVCQLAVIENGVFDVLYATYYSAPVNSWFQFRLTWYMGKDPECNDALVIELAYNHGAGWVDLITFYVTDPLWQDSPTKRVGIRFKTYIDDTEIWGPA